jgi:diguanylate cyclase (GGDEF)-like protein
MGMPIARLLTAASAEQCFNPDGSPRTVSGQAWECRKKNGATLPVMFSLSVFMHDNMPYYTAIIQNISERVMYEKRLARLAYYDSLTGLPNRRLFHERLGRALTRAKRNEKLVAILFLDLDHFKDINDTLGHHIGDLLLQETAKRLTALIREDDTVARLGGDEFTVVLENISVVTEAEAVANKILQALSQPLLLGTEEIYVTASIGITYYPLDDSEIEKLIMNADGAMYQAKAHGRNTFEVYTAKLRTEAAQRLAMDIALRKAISATDFLLHYQPEFILHYQPEIDQYTGEVVSVEALVRWQHPELGLLGPDSFIPLSEETGLIDAIGEWVLRAACKPATSWRAAGLPTFNVAVNVSALQLQNRDFVDMVAKILEETGLDAKYLELELTESMILNKTEAFIAILRDLKAMGITLTIDDFGTGHSSLANLQLLPIDKVKIDRSFVNNITTNEQDATIAVSVIEMAHKLGIKVVAEGVETEEQLRYLYTHHCDIMQGYHFSRPVVAEDFETLLATGVELSPLSAL